MSSTPKWTVESNGRNSGIPENRKHVWFSLFLCEVLEGGTSRWDKKEAKKRKEKKEQEKKKQKKKQKWQEKKKRGKERREIRRGTTLLRRRAPRKNGEVNEEKN
jgi:hypothetical protein